MREVLRYKSRYSTRCFPYRWRPCQDLSSGQDEMEFGRYRVISRRQIIDTELLTDQQVDVIRGVFDHLRQLRDSSLEELTRLSFNTTWIMAWWWKFQFGGGKRVLFWNSLSDMNFLIVRHLRWCMRPSISISAVSIEDDAPLFIFFWWIADSFYFVQIY